MTTLQIQLRTTVSFTFVNHEYVQSEIVPECTTRVIFLTQQNHAYLNLSFSILVQKQGQFCPSVFYVAVTKIQSHRKTKMLIMHF